MGFAPRSSRRVEPTAVQFSERNQQSRLLILKRILMSIADKSPCAPDVGHDQHGRLPGVVAAFVPNDGLADSACFRRHRKPTEGVVLAWERRMQGIDRLRAEIARRCGSARD